jgi:hypothetical protein
MSDEAPMTPRITALNCLACALALGAALTVFPALAKSIPVSAASEADFRAAMAAAQDGDTIELSGTGYLSDKAVLTHAKPVTIDTTNAIVTGFDLENATGFILTGPGWREPPNQRYPFAIKLVNDTNVTIQHARIIGSAIGHSAAYNAAGATPGISVGLSVTGGRDITIRDSYLEAFTTTIAARLVTNFTADGNFLRKEENDAMNLVSLTGARITNNDARDWDVPGGNKLHSDSRQWWVVNDASGKPVPNTDILVQNNVTIGPVQGDWMPNQGVPAGQIAYRNVQIIGNITLGGAPNGMTMMMGQNVTVRGNILGPAPGNTSRTSQPVYNFRNVSGLTFDQNVLYWYAPNWDVRYILATGTSALSTPYRVVSKTAPKAGQNAIFWNTTPAVPADPLAGRYSKAPPK